MLSVHGETKKCENVLPLQFKGFLVLTHTAFFTPLSNQFFSLSKMAASLTSI